MSISPQGPKGYSVWSLYVLPMTIWVSSSRRIGHAKLTLGMDKCVNVMYGARQRTDIQSNPIHPTSSPVFPG